MLKPELFKLKPEDIILMSDLSARRRQLRHMQTIEKNRLQMIPKEIDIKPHKLIKSCDEYTIKNNIIQSLPRVLKMVAFTLISICLSLAILTIKKYHL